MRKLVYIVAVLWVAAFIWQTIAHANPPVPFDHNGTFDGTPHTTGRPIHGY